ncbi:MAG: hypothetical protein AB7O52_07000 [Planctomycetota bacterium]
MSKRQESESLRPFADSAEFFPAPAEKAAEAVPRGDDVVPCRIGDYDVLETLGRGGMGTVYRARQARAPRDVAIKVILGDPLDPDALPRFQREIGLLAAIEHPSVVWIYAADF